MERIEALLAKHVVQAIKELFGADISESMVQIQRTRKEFEGDFTVVTFPFIKAARKSPEETGRLLGEALLSLDEVSGFNVVKGFLNLSIVDSWWLDFLNSTLSEPTWGFGKKGSQPQVMVEYSSPNTNKPLHLGHLRNNFLGYSVARILEAVGHDVVKVQIINDRGIHICKSMVAWQQFGEGETPQSNGVKGDHLVGKYYVQFETAYKKEIKELMAAGMAEDDAKKQAPIMLAARETLQKWEAKDPDTIALWEKMNSWVYAGFEQTYQEMGVSFDKLYYESQTYLTGKDVIAKGLEQGVFSQREDGSVWCDLTDDGLDEKLLLRSDGTAVYMTQDVGTAMLRFTDYPNLSHQLYTVGNEQEYHFKVLFLILKKLGFEKAANNYHLSYGMVELPEGKMKSREGTVVDADELLSEMAATAQEITDELGKLEGMDETDRSDLFKTLGYGALKYFLLKVDPRKSMMFDPKESIDFNGNTGPYIQFNYVRTRSILRRYESEVPKSIDINTPINESERSLIKMIYEFPTVLEEAAKDYNPAVIANYSYGLVREYSSFYQVNPILKEDDEKLKQLRVALSSKMGEVLKSGMNLLGITMPERM
jgi:arginyl-tRNA synthetase